MRMGKRRRRHATLDGRMAILRQADEAAAPITGGLRRACRRRCRLLNSAEGDVDTMFYQLCRPKTDVTADRVRDWTDIGWTHMAVRLDRISCNRTAL